jgi:hypothetical protein
MKRALICLALGSIGLATVVQGASAAPAKETIHLTAPTGMAALHMTMGVANVTYAAHETSVKIAAQHLPAASMIHNGKFYVVWLKQGSKSWFLGDLKTTGATGALTGMAMIKHFQNLNITAESSAHPMHATGALVLSGMSNM